MDSNNNDNTLNNIEGDDNDDQNFNTIDFFKDKDAVIMTIEQLVSLSWEKYLDKIEWLSMTLTRYQEQPSLLAPSLLLMLTPLADKIIDLANNIRININNNDNDNDTNKKHFNVCCKAIQIICKVRGYKHVNKTLPHEVNHMETCLFLLTLQVLILTLILILLIILILILI